MAAGWRARDREISRECQSISKWILSRTSHTADVSSISGSVGLDKSQRLRLECRTINGSPTPSIVPSGSVVTTLGPATFSSTTAMAPRLSQPLRFHECPATGTSLAIGRLPLIASL